MRIYRTLADVPPSFGPSALTIGNFDGVHCGHRRILRRLKSLADEHRWKPSVLTFHPHPTRVVAPARTPKLLTTPDRRMELMSADGVEQTLILPFTREVAALSAQEFVETLLVGRLGARAVLVGDNFRFGYRQVGNVDLLRQLGAQFGFVTEIVPAVSWRGVAVSSSAIRDLILAGRVNLAARLLQHAYGVEGSVASGRGIGSRQTVPTLNLVTEAEVLPAPGVYVTHTRALEGVSPARPVAHKGTPGPVAHKGTPGPVAHKGTPGRFEGFSPARGFEGVREWNSITNIGYRPTFGASDELSIETFLLDPLEGETPQRIRVDFLRRVRDERRFDSPEALRTQILKDVRVASSYFRRTKNWIGGVPCIFS